MSEMAPDPAATRREMYDVSYGGHALGGLQKVDLSKLVMMLDAIMIGSFGKLKLDDRFVGLEAGAQVSIDVVQTNRQMINLAIATGTPGVGTTEVPLVPATLNTLMSATYGKALLIHPRSKLTDVSEDLELYKTVQVGAPISRTGTADDVWTLVFNVYPDMTKLAAGTENPYGRWKAGS
jgi:hypothetical protein